MLNSQSMTVPIHTSSSVQFRCCALCSTHTSPLRTQWFPNVAARDALHLRLKAGLRWWVRPILFVCLTSVQIVPFQTAGTQARSALRSQPFRICTLHSHWGAISILRSSNYVSILFYLGWFHRIRGPPGQYRKCYPLKDSQHFGETENSMVNVDRDQFTTLCPIFLSMGAPL